MNWPTETQETEFPNETPADNATSDMAETPEAESPKTTETTATETVGATETADDEEKEEATAEAISKFRELTAARMSAIGQQLFQMKKFREKEDLITPEKMSKKIFTKKIKKQRPFRVGFTIPEFRCNVQLFSEIPVRQMLQSIHLTIKYALSSNISKV